MMSACSSSVQWAEEKVDESKETYQTSQTKKVIDDVWITAEIDATFLLEKDFPSRWISIQVLKGEVLLTGSMPSQALIDRAVAICKQVDGVKHVDNRLKVGTPSVRSVFTDALITATVKARLLDDTVTPGWSIHVKTDHGRVYLRGEISDPAERYRAKAIVENVDGVTAIVDMLRLRRP